LRDLREIIGHIQFASVPDRGTPDRGAVDYRDVFAVIEETQWASPLGAEYRPVGDTDSTLGWMDRLRYPARYQTK
jgi:hydroxypyruvate isomerase